MCLESISPAHLLLEVRRGTCLRCTMTMTSKKNKDICLAKPIPAKNLFQSSLILILDAKGGFWRREGPWGKGFKNLLYNFIYLNNGGFSENVAEFSFKLAFALKGKCQVLLWCVSAVKCKVYLSCEVFFSCEVLLSCEVFLPCVKAVTKVGVQSGPKGVSDKELLKEALKVAKTKG